MKYKKYIIYISLVCTLKALNACSYKYFHILQLQGDVLYVALNVLLSEVTKFNKLITVIWVSGVSSFRVIQSNGNERDVSHSQSVHVYTVGQKERKHYWDVQWVCL